MRAAVLIPAWQEAAIIEFTIAHALAAWPQAELRIYVGCYRNDADTLEAVDQTKLQTFGEMLVLTLTRIVRETRF